MKKNYFVLALLSVSLSILISSCKKDSAPSTTASSSTNNNSGVTVDASGTASGTYNTVLYETRFTFGNSTSNYPAAYFFKNPIPIIASAFTPDTNVNFVSLNGVLFKNIQIGLYSDTTGSITFPPANWIVSGNATIPSFTYTNSEAVPVMDTSVVPANVSRLTDLTVSLSGCSGYNAAYLNISDQYFKATKIGSNSSTSITIKADSLAKLTTMSNGYLTLALIKYTARPFGGKNVVFMTERMFKKSIAIQ